VEFADPEVATIVADTMSGYLLLEKRLVCHVLPRNKVDHELMFARPKRVPTKKDRQKKARSEINKARSKSVISKITSRLVKREELKRKNMEALGIEYDFPGYAASAAAAQSSAATTTGSEKVDGVSKKEKKKRKFSNSSVEVKEDAIGDGPVENSLELLKKKKKKSKKEDSNEKSGGELEMHNNVASDHSKEDKKKKSKKDDTKQKRGEEAGNRVAADSESLKKKASKTKTKMPKKG
jgi:nucleolar protein 15